MCFALYIASDKKLQEIDNNDKYEHISIYGLNCDDFSEVINVETHFTKRYIYSFYGGGCACDFQYTVISKMSEIAKDVVKEIVTDIVEKRKKTVQAFFNYLNDQLEEGEQIEIYYCWMGDEDKPRESILDAEINLKKLDLQDEFGFRERQYILVKK